MTHRSAVRTWRLVMLAPCRLAHPHMSRDSSFTRWPRGARSAAFLIPWQCCSLKVTRLVSWDRGRSLREWVAN